MKRRDILKLTGLAAAGFPLGAKLSSALAAKPESLSIMTWGGLWGNGMAKYVDQPFTTQTGVKIIQDQGSSPVQRITKLKIGLNDQRYDLVQLHDGVIPLAEAQGVLEDLDPGSPNMPFLKDIPARFRRKGWVAMIYSALGVVYNPKYVKKVPTGFADLWNPAYKGSIVLPEITHSIGPYIIPIGALAAGKDPKDAGAGFEMLRRMAALNPIWAKDTDTLMSAMVNEEAVIGLLYKSQTYTIREQGSNAEWVFPKEGAISYLSGTGIAKNTKHRDFAEKYINATIDPSLQGWVTKVFNYAPTNPAALKTLSPQLQERVQFTDAQIARIIDLDQDYMSKNRAAWTDRWNRIVAGG